MIDLNKNSQNVDILVGADNLWVAFIVQPAYLERIR